MNDDMSAFNCGAFIAVSVALQVVTLMFEEVRWLALWGAGIFFVTSGVVNATHFYLGVSWGTLYVGAFFYFLLTLSVGEYFSRRRTRKHKARMAEIERKEQALLAELNDATRKLRGEEIMQ